MRLRRSVSGWIIFLLVAGVGEVRAQQSASMPGVENSVGYLASGTSIQPMTTSESTAMVHRFFGNWTAMLHANAFVLDIQQSGPRGRDKFLSTNWFMPMMHRQAGRHGVLFRAMLSMEPATISRREYPLLFQTGETANGFSIVDGQHPHDFLMEAAARYDIALGERSQIFVYGGPVAEAALGPTPFPHRLSASENPLAVLGHHQQDSTHISTNVISVGFAKGPAQLEASAFHGREPDENRWSLGTGKPDSFASRLTISPHKTVVSQFSIGRINEPEPSDAGVDVVRTTASIHHNRPIHAGHISSSLIWGRNKNISGDARRIFNSYNLEVTGKFQRNWVWTRFENVDRDRSLLPVTAEPPEPACRLCGIVGRGIEIDDDRFKPVPFSHVAQGPDGNPILIEETPIGRVQAYTLGYERELPSPAGWMNIGLGMQVTVYGFPSQLRAVYGDRPSTLVAFLRIRPSGNMQEHMRRMHQ